ncbi:MAG: NAD(+) synthase [Thermogutta sp.]
MSRIRVAGAAINQTPLDWAGNLANILNAIELAKEEDVSILCLPELCLTGYGCEDAFHSPHLHQTALELLHECAAATKGILVSVGLPLFHRSAVFNCGCLLGDGKIFGFVPKRYLASEGLHYEPRWFKPWPAGVRDHISIGDRYYPIGDYVFEVGGIRIGFEICEDAWVPQRSGAELASRGVDIILNPSASHFSFGKHEVRKRFVIEGSRSFCAGYIYTNLLGNEAGRVIYDGGVLIASAGRLLAVGPRFAFHPVVVTAATIDVAVNRMSRARSAGFQTSSLFDRDVAIVIPWTYPDVEPRVEYPQIAAWETGNFLKEEEFTRAVMLGLFDYLRKSRAHGFVVNVSGGADSSAVACLAALMIEAAHNELGHEAFCKALDHIPGLRQTENHQQRISLLLHGLYQATRNSSQATQEAAAAVVTSLGGTMSSISVDEIVHRYVETIQGVLGFELNWKDHDVALQNIQARARGPSAWLLANVKKALLLTTSNRSEAAVGYATMDGDTCGCLSPIAGINKSYLRDWLKWLEKIGPEGLHPVPALAKVNSLTPTAELRPSQEQQTDESDLMPYVVLDFIEKLAIRDKMSPVDIYRSARNEFPEYSSPQLASWVEKFFQLWCQNQWKRERYAPAFHLDDEDLDPRSWCRFPILSGGYQRELAQLRKYIEETAGHW